jgi:hypothetical protein
MPENISGNCITFFALAEDKKSVRHCAGSSGHYKIARPVKTFFARQNRLVQARVAVRFLIP